MTRQPRMSGTLVAFTRCVLLFASLKLTVTLFGLSIFLIFAGTLAQTERGIWAVMEQYFRTLIAWIEIRPLTFGLIDSDAAFPYPGGYLLGGILLVNLLCAHLMRFHMTWRKSGIALIHTGLIVLLLSEFFTALFAVEGQMIIYKDGVSNYVEDIREVELALIDKSNPQLDTVIAIPESHLRGGNILLDEQLPFPVRIERFDAHSRLLPREGEAAQTPSLATAGDGLHFVSVPRPRVTGVDRNESVNYPSAYVTVMDVATRQPIQTFLTSAHFSVNHRPQVIEVEGRTYHLFLRFKRSYRSFAMHLLELRHDRYIGTNKPRNFSSRLRLVDPVRGEDREVLIAMNKPLRYAGETFYQKALLEGDVATVLLVVNNPGWLMPYVSCVLVSVGLLLQFGLSLTRFAGRRKR